MKKKGLCGVAVCMAAVSLWGCGKQQPEKIEKGRIGVACYNERDTFINALVESFKEQMSQYEKQGFKAEVTVTDAGGMQRSQDDQVKEMITAGCDVLCVNLVDRTDPSEIIDLAREKDVPIIFFNREPVAEDMLQWNGLYYVGAYAEQSGIMQGELAAEAIEKNDKIDKNKDGKIQYAVLEGEPGHQDAIIRTENAVDTMKKKGIKMEKISYGIANWSRAQAQNRMLQMISQYPNKIELVLANNDDMILGALDAYEKLNLTETSVPVFFGIDGTDQGLEALREGKIAGTVYNDKEGQAKAMAQLAVALITGEGLDEISFENEKYIYLPYTKVTSENVKDFIGKSEEN